MTSRGHFIETKRPEKRVSARAKLSRMLRVRPSEGDADHFEELPVTTNVSKRGIYFHTHLPNYRVGMRLFDTYPFTFMNDSMKSEYRRTLTKVDSVG